MTYHWVEWDIWDRRTRRYAIIEKRIMFEKNKKNGVVCIKELDSVWIECLWRDVAKWMSCKGVYGPSEEWRPDVKMLDGVTHRTKIFEIVGKNGEMIAFGHGIFETKFSVKLPD